MIPRLSPPFDLSDFRALMKGLCEDGGVSGFEAAVAAFSGRRFALAFPTGRSGLYALIKTMGWQNREIILPAYSCAAVPNAILATGNRPRFVDVDPADFNMRPDLIGRAVGSDTAAVLATHMYGFPMDLDGLEEVLRDYPDVAVIQDCALALGTRYKGQPVCRHGLAGMYSFSIGKHVSTVEGGCIVTDDAELYHAMNSFRERHFTSPGIRRKISGTLFFLSAWLGLRPGFYRLVHQLSTKTKWLEFLSEHYADDRVFFPASLLEKIPPFLGRLGENQIGKAENLVGRRIEISRYFREKVRTGSNIEWPTPREGGSFSHSPCLVDDREGFIAFMEGNGIHVGKEVFDYVLPDIPLFRPFSDQQYEAARYLAAHAALIPNHPGLRPAEVGRIVAAMRDWRRP